MLAAGQKRSEPRGYGYCLMHGADTHIMYLPGGFHGQQQPDHIKRRKVHDCHRWPSVKLCMGHVGSPAFVPLCWARADDLFSDLWVVAWQPCSPGPGDETAIDKRKRNCLASARFRQKKKAEMQVST
jgi:hypothetical protein